MTHNDKKLTGNDVETLKEIAENSDNPQLKRAIERKIKKIEKNDNTACK